MSQEAKSIALLALRHGPLEDLHAGRICEACSGSDEVSHISNGDMRNIMKHAVNVIFQLLTLRESDPSEYRMRIQFAERYTAHWDEPDPEAKVTTD